MSVEPGLSPKAQWMFKNNSKLQPIRCNVFSIYLFL